MFTDFFTAHPETPVSSGLPWPAGADRAAWEDVRLKDAALAGARSAREIPYPLLTAGQFLAYARTGDRQTFEVPYFQRRQKLIRLVVGECLTWDGSFLDGVIDGLWLLAEETGWAVSAHNVDAHPGSPTPEERPLPDAENPVVDLFAAQTGATVSLVCHLLADKLDAVSPMIRRRMRLEVERRVLSPFFRRDDFWWMGMIRRDVNNWTPWILSNVLACLLYWEADPFRRREGTVRAARMLDLYLDTLPDDGGCDEGAGYWNMAGAALMDCLELLRFATGERADFYGDKKLCAVAAFPLAAHIAGPYFWNFADCDARPRLDGERVLCFGLRTGNPRLAKLGASLMTGDADPWPVDTPQFSRVLDRLFAAEIPAEPESAPEGAILLPDLQVWACRRGRHYAAIKGGHNGENHNHNDVGSFLFYIGGLPAVVDAGNLTYTRQTFSDHRYALWNTRSGNHNLPLIGGMEQLPGREHRAEDVCLNASGVRMRLESAYPAACGIRAFTRGARMDGALRIRDEILLESPLAVEWVFLLREEPRLKSGEVLAGRMRLRFPAALRAAARSIPVTDARMARSFPGEIWRLTLSAAPATAHEAEFILEENGNGQPGGQ